MAFLYYDNKILTYNNQKLDYGGVIYEPETYALLARMSQEPTIALKELINKTVVDLKTEGIWDKLAQFNKCNIHNAADAVLNWKGDIFNLVAVNSPSYIPKKGFKTASGQYLKSGFIPSIQIANGTIGEDDACFGIDKYESSGQYSTYKISGAWNTTYHRYQLTHYTRDSPEGIIAGAVLNWGAGTNITYDRGDSEGLFFGERDGSANRGYLNSVFGYENATTTSTTNCDRELYFGALNNSGSANYYSYEYIRTVLVGKYLGKQLELYNILKYFDDNVNSTF